MTAEVRSADGTPIAYERSGDGPPLVVVAGAFCDRRSFASLAAILESRFTVYRYDRRGRGASGDTAPYAVEREIEDLDAVIDRIGGTPFVFGHSSGAVLSLEAVAAGLPAGRLAVYEPPYLADDSLPRAVDLADRSARLIAAGRRAETVQLFMENIRGGPMTAEAVAEMQSAPSWPYLEGMAHTLPYDLAIVGDCTIPADRLAKIAVPTLVLAGGASNERFRDAMLAVSAAVPDGRHLSVPEQDHNPADGVLAPVLVEFFAT